MVSRFSVSVNQKDMDKNTKKATIDTTAIFFPSPRRLALVSRRTIGRSTIHNARVVGRWKKTTLLSLAAVYGEFAVGERQKNPSVFSLFSHFFLFSFDRFYISNDSIKIFPKTPLDKSRPKKCARERKRNRTNNEEEEEEEDEDER